LSFGLIDVRRATILAKNFIDHVGVIKKVMCVFVCLDKLSKIVKNFETCDI